SGADDVTDTEILRSYGGAERSPGEPPGARLGLLRPSEDRFHQEGVNAAETKSPEHAASEGPATFARDQDISARCAFGKRQVPVFLDDELTPQRNHEEHAEPSTE